MDADLQAVYDEVMQAAHPEDLFGSDDVVLPAKDLLEFLRSKYEPLKQVTAQVYQNPGDAQSAAEADQKLEELYRRAQERIRLHIYGIEGRGRLPPAAFKPFEVGPNRYFRGPQMQAGEHASLYEGFMEHRGDSVGEVVIKIASDQQFNDFILNEARVLDLLHDQDAPQWKHLPFVFDRFQSGGRAGLIFRKISGFTLTQVRQHRNYTGGVNQRDMVWMLARSLSCLGYVHSQGVAHGDLTPGHLMIQPRNHNLIAVGWSSGVRDPAVSGEKVLKYSGEWSAPEVRRHGKIGPWSDIYSLGKIMIWLLGGDPRRKEVPSQVEPAIGAFLCKMIHEDPMARPADAWALWDEQEKLKDRLWRRTYRHFDMS